MWNIDGTGDGDGEDTQKVQHKYGSRAGDGVDPYDLRWDIDRTGGRDGVDPQKVQHKYGSGTGARDGVNSPPQII